MSEANKVEMGRIRRLNLDKGYGFISRVPSGADTFFHFSSLIGVAMEHLREGDDVSFVDGIGNNGKARATVVRRVS